MRTDPRTLRARANKTPWARRLDLRAQSRETARSPEVLDPAVRNPSGELLSSRSSARATSSAEASREGRMPFITAL
jgi:hypothetical protein